MTPADLKAWRTLQGLDQRQLADRLGVHVLTVSRWERGQTPIPRWLHLALWAIEHRAPADYRGVPVPREPIWDRKGELTPRGREVEARVNAIHAKYGLP